MGEGTVFVCMQARTVPSPINCVIRSTTRARFIVRLLKAKNRLLSHMNIKIISINTR